MTAVRLAVAFLIGCLALASPAAMAHRIDEYLQATMVTVSPGRVEASMRLIPGVLLAPSVIAAIDGDGDDVLSEAEQHAYARRVLADQFITLDGMAVAARLVSWRFPELAEMREGIGEIRIEYRAELVDAPGARTLTLVNQHRNSASVYLVNAVVPDNATIQLVSQTRNESQSVYVLTYRQDSLPVVSTLDPSRHAWLDDVEAASLFGLGIRHIAEGTDHLLFLLALLLSAPLVAAGGRWSQPTTVGRSMRRIAGVVTAFTVGHSITLALVGLGYAQVPGRPVEVLVALSILVSAVHAVVPLFPRREAWVAGVFGLVHGMAFASTLDRLGLGLWDRAVGVVTFNLGIEAMQLLVVGCALPSLLLLSRTPAYGVVRLAIAALAGSAAVAWIAERSLNVQTPIDMLVDGLAAQAPWLAAASFLASATTYVLRKRTSAEAGPV